MHEINPLEDEKLEETNRQLERGVADKAIKEPGLSTGKVRSKNICLVRLIVG